MMDIDLFPMMDYPKPPEGIEFVEPTTAEDPAMSNAIMKRCPFCGAYPTIERVQATDRTGGPNDGKIVVHYFIKDHCGMVNLGMDSEEELIQRWNTRKDKP